MPDNEQTITEVVVPYSYSMVTSGQGLTLGPPYTIKSGIETALEDIRMRLELQEAHLKQLKDQICHLTELVDKMNRSQLWS